MAYLLDANVLIQAKNYHYGFTLCPGFWMWLDYSNKAGRVLSIKAVRDELMALEDELSSWVKPRKDLFVPTDDGTTFESLKLLSSWVMEKYRPAAQAEFMGAADFKLIGYAHAHNHIIVTHEVAAYGEKVKIPNACVALGVTHMSPFQMLRKEGARFSLEAAKSDSN